MNVPVRLRILIAIAVVLSVVVGWRLVSGGGDRRNLGPDEARIDKLRRAGDVEALAAEIAGADEEAACRAVKAMASVGAKAVGHIERAMQDPRPKIRQKATLAYVRAAEPKQAAPLAKAARDDESPGVRAAAVTGIGRLCAYEEMETLLAAMDDPNLMVRRRAADAVAHIIGRRYRYNANDSSDKRRASIAVIRDVWAKDKKMIGRYHDHKSKKP